MMIWGRLPEMVGPPFLYNPLKTNKMKKQKYESQLNLLKVVRKKT